MKPDYRFHYYLSGKYHSINTSIRWSTFALPDHILEINTRDFEKAYSKCEKCAQDDNYLDDLKKYLPTQLTNPLYLYPKDRCEAFNTPVLCKSRPIDDPECSILLLLHSGRHKKPIERARSILHTPFSEKKSKIVWRGTPTGYGFGNNIPYRKANRERLLELYFKKHDFIDVGLTELLTRTDPKFSRYVVDKKDMKSLLEYKYILSVEGNDVASGLKWNLAASSVVMMAKPTICSWYMEDHLQPFVHYIPLSDDFSDLVEKFHWAESHPHECEMIIQNANNFIQMFDDDMLELDINRRIVDWYSQNVIYDKSF